MAAALLLVAATAVAHEFDHQFHKHDVPCALHFYAGHLDGAAPSSVNFTVASPKHDVPGTAAACAAAREPIVPYAVRAPPVFAST